MKRFKIFWTILIKYLILWTIGGFLYFIIENLWRGYSHGSMFVVGGICFILIGLINELLSWETPLWIQMIFAAGIITIVEFIAGCILNLYLGLGVWDYSNVPFNLLGQVCLSYFVLWFFLSLAGILIDDYLRYWIFDEKKPQYKII